MAETAVKPASGAVWPIPKNSSWDLNPRRLAVALSYPQRQAIGIYLSKLFGSARFRILEVDLSRDPAVCVEIVWPFDHGRNFKGVRVGIPKGVLDGVVQKAEPSPPTSGWVGGNVRNSRRSFVKGAR